MALIGPWQICHLAMGLLCLMRYISKFWKEELKKRKFVKFVKIKTEVDKELAMQKSLQIPLEGCLLTNTFICQKKHQYDVISHQ